MTALVGNDGSITMPTGFTGALIRQWTANAEYVVSEVTGFTDARMRRHRRGLPLFRGSITGTASKDASATNPGAGATGGSTGSSAGPGGSSLVLTVASSCTWTFTALMSNIGLGPDKVGDSGLTYEFIGGDADDFVEAWDVT